MLAVDFLWWASPRGCGGGFDVIVIKYGATFDDSFNDFLDLCEKAWELINYPSMFYVELNIKHG